MTQTSTSTIVIISNGLTEAQYQTIKSSLLSQIATYNSQNPGQTTTLTTAHFEENGV